MGAAEYRESALRVALDPTHPLHLVPVVPPNVRRLLDVGCHAGHILEAMHLPADCEVFGCDINAEALALARKHLPCGTFVEGRAEKLPYDSATFDMLFSRGVVTTIAIPQALAEFNRVLKPGGKLWLSLHRWRDCRIVLQGGWTEHRVKTLALGAYVIGNSVCFHCSGKMFRYPLNRSRIVSFQTPQRMRKELHRSRFGKITFSYGKYLVVEATKLGSGILTIPQAAFSSSTTADELKTVA